MRPKPDDGSASGGVLVLGGPGHGTRPDGGAYFSNLEGDYSAPATATNDKAVNNTITNDVCYNASYVAAVSDVGNNDKIINNKTAGYSCPTAYNAAGNAIDASSDFTNRPKVHANK